MRPGYTRGREPREPQVILDDSDAAARTIRA
jgi:hypothetical protein